MSDPEVIELEIVVEAEPQVIEVVVEADPAIIEAQVETGPAVIEVEADEGPAIIEVEVPGLMGPAGRDGGAAVPILGAVALGGHRVIRASADGARIASADALDDAGLVIGITVGATDAGAEVRFLATGPLVEPSWAWALGPVYLGQDGRLTQVPPRAAFEQQVGTAMAPDRILVRIDPHIILAPEA